MTDHSRNLELPFLMPAQAQKHVTVNEALLRLDALVQLCVESATVTAQPASPTDGTLWILPAGKTGADWGAMAIGALAYWRDGIWEEVTPRAGWRTWVLDAGQLKTFDGAAWTGAVATTLLTTAATDRVLGRVSAGGGAVEEIAFTDQAQQLCDDTSFAAMRATLGLGSMAVEAAASYAPLTGATFTGDLTLNNANVSMSGAMPLFGFYETDAAANNRRYWLYANGGAFNIEFVNDAISSSATVLSIPRSANTATAFKVAAPILPMTDNTHTLGSASFRFSTVYAATGTINTSDAREKSRLLTPPDAALRALKRVIGSISVFQWKEAIARKGEAGARLHVGVTAQAVRDAFLAEGEDPERWALFCADPRMEVVDVAEDGEISAPNADLSAVPADPRRVLTRNRVERPVLDESGAPDMVLGLRHDQLLLLALAAMAR